MQGFGEPLLAQEDIDTLFAPLEPPSSVVYSAQGPLPLSAANLERNNDSNAPKADHSHVLTTHPQQLTPRTPLPTSPPSPLSGSPSALRMSATQARALLTAGPYTRKNGAQTVEVTGDVVHFFDTETAAPLPPARVLCVTERVSEDSNDGSVGPSLISGTPIENIGKERRFGRMLLAPQQPSYQPYAPPLESRARTEITLLGVSLLDLNANEAVWADGDCWAAVNPPDVMTPIDSHLNMTVRYAQNLTSPPPIEEMEDEERGRAMSKNTTTASLPSVPAAPTASMQAMLSAEHIPLWRRLFCCAVDLSKAYNSSDPEEEVDYTLPFAVRLIAMVQSTLECYLSGTANDDSYWSEQSCAELVVMLVLAMRRECSFAHPGHCIDIVMYCASRLQATPASLPKVIQQLRRAHASTDPQINGGARSNVDIISHWWAVDKDGSGLLDFAELRELMSRLNSSISVAKLREKLRNFDLDGNNELDFFEFVRFYYALQRREGIAQQVEKVHAQYFGDSNTQGLQHGMRRFLEEVQKEDGANSTTTQNELEMWFGRFAPLPASWERYNFVRYLCSAGNTWNDPAHNAFRKEDMDYPLSAYYINSSHNTYLTGDQLTSVSSVHMYQRALADGGRCIEIDVCAEGGRLMVKHVNTPTMPIRFVDVLNTVRQFAFAKSKYPVIISLENRVDSKRDQEEMARQLKAVLGTALYVKKLDGCDYTHSSFTAHALRGRFLLRSKANCCRALLDLVCAFVLQSRSKQSSYSKPPTTTDLLHNRPCRCKSRPCEASLCWEVPKVYSCVPFFPLPDAS